MQAALDVNRIKAKRFGLISKNITYTNGLSEKCD